MHPTHKPFVTKAEVPCFQLRCSHCFGLHTSPYRLNGRKSICQNCIKQHSLPEIGDRSHQVLKLIKQGYSNAEIQEKLEITWHQLRGDFEALKNSGLVVRSTDKHRRTIPWQNPSTGTEILLSRREKEVLEQFYSPELQYTHRYCEEIGKRLNLSRTRVSNTLRELRKKGINLPTRQERDREWERKVKEDVLLKRKNVKGLARLRGTNPYSPSQYLSKKGFRRRSGKTAPQILYKFLQSQGQASRTQLVEFCHSQGFSKRSGSCAIFTLKRLGLVDEWGGILVVTKQVEISEIRRTQEYFQSKRKKENQKNYATH